MITHISERAVDQDGITTAQQTSRIYLWKMYFVVVDLKHEL